MTVAAEARKKIRGRIAEAGIRRRDVAHAVGYSESMFSLILQGDRTMPPDFEFPRTRRGRPSGGGGGGGSRGQGAGSGGGGGVGREGRVDLGITVATLYMLVP